jgi:hypothetical protein
MSRWQWLIAVIALLALLLFAVIVRGDAQGQGEPSLYEGVPLDVTLLHLDKAALDESYRAQVQKLFGVWLSDGAREADRIKSGLKIARRSYNMAAQQIARREQELLEQDRQRQDKP